MQKLYLIDAYALIFRAYYAFVRTPRINSKGKNTSAIFGFLNTFEEILRRENPTHIAVVFDPAGPTFRHEEFQSYKANRSATPEDIHAAVPIIQRLMEAYGVKVLQVPGYEADDVIGTLAVKAEAEGFDVYMVTPDKDYGQLVTDHISILKPRSGQNDIELQGPKQIIGKWGIESPAQVIDLLGLMGDTADNIPGCPGVGEKTAVRLLNQYGSIERIIENAPEIKGALGKKIQENTQQIIDSKYLATICTSVPVDFVADDFVLTPRITDALADIFTELEFKTHLKRLQDDADAAKPPVVQPSLFGNDEPAGIPSTAAVRPQRSIDTEPHEYVVVDADDDIEPLVSRLQNAEAVAFALVTDTAESMTCRPLGIAIAPITAPAGHKAYYIPFGSEAADIKCRLARLEPLLASPTVKAGHNIKHQLIVLQRFGVDVAPALFDCEVAHYLLQPEQKHDIEYLASSLVGYTAISYESLVGPKGKRQLTLDMLGKSATARYASEMADIIASLYQPLSDKLAVQQLTSLFADVEMPLVRVLARMEMNGVLVDDFALSQISNTLTAQMNAIERHIRELSGADINLSSPKQVGELLFDTLGLSDKARKTRKGQYATDEETLEAIRSKHPVVGEILEYRRLRKLLSTYVDALPRLINVHTGRVHTSYNQTVTATGRLSSSNPNLQNIPVRTDNGREIRRAFIASEGHRFLSADYSQVELRIMAHLSADRNMLDAFNSDHDIHAATAAKIYHVPLDAVTGDMRRKAKTANFGIIYGISPFGLAERLSISRTEAKELIDNYFVSFPQVSRYISDAVENARRTGYVETLMHRRRYLPDINSRNPVVRSYAERNAVNAPIQGAAADIIKVAMVRIDKVLADNNLKTKMILQVHDELNFDVPTDELDIVTDLVRREMEAAFKLSVPLKVDIGIGADWLEAH